MHSADVHQPQASAAEHVQLCCEGSKASKEISSSASNTKKHARVCPFGLSTEQGIKYLNIP